jgi:hypothetical protein
MKITMEKSRVIMLPENDEETKQLEKLWNALVGCTTDSHKLVPIGEFVPLKGKKEAMFYIEEQKVTG